MTLTELARKYLRARSAVIWERSSDIDGDLVALRMEVAYEINPMLVAVGLPALDANEEVEIASQDEA